MGLEWIRENCLCLYKYLITYDNLITLLYNKE